MSQPPASDATELPGGNAEGRTSGSGSDSANALLTYASSWFTYHAGQRLQSFNFFVALQTALLAVVALQYGTAGGVTLSIFGVVGCVGTLLFAALEIRNTELVLAGGAALGALETSFRSDTGGRAAAIPLPYSSDTARLYLREALIGFLTSKDIEPIGCRQASRRRYKVLGYVIRNSFVLRTIFLLTLVGWLIFVGLILTAYQPSRPSCSVTVRGGAAARVVCATASPPFVPNPSSTAPG